MKAKDPFPIEEMVKHFYYDAETGHIHWVGTGMHRPAGEVCNSISRYGYRRVKIMGYQIPCHRLAWALHYGEWPNGMIDHINRDRLDNRISNLRLVNGSQNATNRRTKNGDAYRGTTRLPSGRWQAQTGIDGKKTYLGSYATREEAHQAYMNFVAPRRPDHLPRECFQ